jgi:hypothetical protein
MKLGTEMYIGGRIIIKGVINLKKVNQRIIFS